MLWTLIRQKGQPLRRPGQKLTAKETAEASFFGLLSGLMTGAIGLSGGGPITAALFLLRCPALRTVGTSVAVISLMSLTGFLGHLTMGHIDWRLVALLASGTITGALAAPPLLSRLGKERAEKVIRPPHHHGKLHPGRAHPHEMIFPSPSFPYIINKIHTFIH